VAEFQKLPVDKFTPPPAQEAYIGKPFRATARFPELVDAGGPQLARLGGWTYDPDRQTLKLTSWVDGATSRSLRSDPEISRTDSDFYGFPINLTNKYLGQFDKSNAFGAAIKVDEYLGRYVLIGSYSPSYHNSKFPYRTSSDIDGEKSIALPAEEARTLTPFLRFFVEGIIVPYSGKRIIACGDAMAPATFERHQENLFDVCVVSARIDRYGVEDSRTGKLIAEWLPPAQPPVPAISQPPFENAVQRDAIAAKGAADAVAKGGIGISFVPTPYGAVIVAVADKSPAERAGLKKGQVIESVNGIRITGFGAPEMMKAVQVPTAIVIYSISGVGDVSVKR
jgi:hypothetical protein